MNRTDRSTCVSATAVPEPASLGVLGLGLAAAVMLATRRQGGQAPA